MPLHVPVAPRPVERPADRGTDRKSTFQPVPDLPVSKLNVTNFGVLGRALQNTGIVQLSARSRVKVRFAELYPAPLLRHHYGLKGRPVAIFLIGSHAPVLP